MARVRSFQVCFVLILPALASLVASCSDEPPLAPGLRTGTVLVTALPDTLGAPWRLEGPAGGLVAGAGDTILPGMAAGRYRMIWEPVPDWAPPVPDVRTDSLAAGDSLVFSGAYARLPDTGFIAVAVTPDTLDAPWLIEGPDFFSYGGSGSTLLGNIPVGDYTITWQGLQWWINPGPFTAGLAVTKGDTSRVAHTYIPGPCNCGDLQIYHTGPTAEFPFAWEMTRRMDPEFFLAGEGDTTLLALTQDYYEVRYLPVLGFVVEFGPFQEHDGDVAVVRVREGMDNAVHGIYIPDEEGMGLLEVVPSPDQLEARWLLEGPYGLAMVGAGRASYLLAPGEYSLTWRAMEGWAEPVPSFASSLLAAGGTITFAGSYLALSPLQVPDFAAGAGPGIGEVDLVWSAVEPVLDPIVDYLAACSTQGPITADSWDLGTTIITVPAVAGRQTYASTFDGTNSGIVPGQPAWFAVRARNGEGELSPLTPETMAVPTFDRTITLRVGDENGDPLPGVPVALLGSGGTAYLGSTDAAGLYTFPVLASNGEFTIETRLPDPGDRFDFRFTVQEDEDPGVVRVDLFPRYPVDAACSGRYVDFLDYLMQMTKTDWPTNDRPDRRLYKWDRFPLAVYLPDNPPAVEYDFPALTRLAMDQWNATMGMALFTEAADSLNADVVAAFSDAVPQVNGQVVMLAPPGVRYLGDAVPEQMGLYLNIGMFPEQRIIEVAMHEMGHILGIYDHSLCSEAGYLMYITSAGTLDQGIENAIHPDEQALVRTIVNLPQGVDMSGYFR